MIIVILGPTGVGKTKLSIELAKRFNGEIINSDSTQVYKGLNIATAKVSDDEKDNIIHHLIDIKEITEDYTVYDYQKDCRKCIDSILKNNKTPIIVGGTGLYVKAALYNYEFNKEEKKYIDENRSNEDLYSELLSIDPNTKVHINNKQRIVRLLNKYYCGNEINVKSDKLLYDAIFIGLTTDRQTLYNRINKRVDMMLSNGLLDEAKKIYESNIRTKAVLTPIGYKELFPYFDKTKSLDDCLEDIRKNSRKYAKRQYTWNRHQFNINWFKVDFDNFDKTVNEVEEYVGGKIEKDNN